MVDKESMQQVIGALIKNPKILSEVDKYNLSIGDFPSKLEKYIFSAIYGLYYGGARKITILDIENYLGTDPVAKQFFESHNGIEYLQDVEELTSVENFQYYYDRLKKFNLLKDLSKKGFDTTSIYIDDLFNEKAFEVNQKFESLTTADIINAFKKELIHLETEYASPEEVESWVVSEEIDEIIASFGEIENIGLPIQGYIYSQVINGAEKGALTIRSGGSGTGKTRSAVADACYLAYPIRYNIETCQWEQNGNNEKVLFIITEQKKEQILKMIIAYLTGINESKFKYGIFSDEEKVRLRRATEIMQTFDNFYIVRIPNPTIELTKTLVREQVITHNIEYLFFDYIFINPALIAEFGGVRLRNDEILLMLATALKDLAIELNISVFTSTQVNAQADNNNTIRNESSIAGSRAIINKADNGCIMARPTKEDLEILERLTSLPIIPNIVTDVYKVRSGQWTQVRIWSYFDAGIMRREDLFITDAQFKTIDTFFDEPQVTIEKWDNNEDILNLVKDFNKND